MKTAGIVLGILAVIIGIALSKAMVKTMWRSQQAASVAATAPPENVFDSAQATEQQHAPPEFYECLLGQLPDVANDLAAQATIAECRASFPNRKGSWPGKPSHLFGYESPTACMATRARNTASNVAAKAIWTACSALY